MRNKILLREDLFKEAASGIVLIGSSCKVCGAIAFPKAKMCTKCLAKEMEDIEVSDHGTLHTYTITRVPVGKFPIPHAIGIINMPEGIRITAPLVYQDKEYEIGAEMKLEKEVLWSEEDHDVIGYKFRTCEADPK